MATQFASQLNAAHQAGIDANGTGGQPLFTGASAATLTAAALTPDQVAAANATSTNGNMLAFGTMRGRDGLALMVGMATAAMRGSSAGLLRRIGSPARRRNGFMRSGIVNLRRG